jgi:FkbM family methyltransferase
MTTSNTSLWLFGGGGACSWIISGLKRETVAIKGIIDDNPNATRDIYGIEIFFPDSPSITTEVKENDTLVVSILNPLVNTQKIIEKLKQQGWKTVLEFGDWVELYYSQTKKSAGPLSSISWETKQKEFTAIRNLLSDDLSVQTLDSFVNFVKEGKNNFPDITPNPYFPKNLKKWNEPLNFIDCGAFDGDTLIEIQKENYKIESAHAFEPDIKNYKQLIKATKTISGVVSWPCGVGDNNESIRFQTQNNMGSFVDANGNSVIQCVRLDDCLPHYIPNLIKMDIEGYELNALHGAETMLKTHMPGLAISVYHLPDDIWQIPLYLKEIYKDKAKFYLRNHSRTIADTILYVIPE